MTTSTAPVPAVRLALVAVLLALVPTVLLPSSPAVAATTDEAVRWAVTPADEQGPDGRAVVEHTLDPGEQVQDRLAVRNLGEEEITFELDAADGFYTRTGRFDMLPAEEESVAAGTWVDLPESVTVAGGGTEVVEFSVTVPERAEPGDHAAGITASIRSVQSAEDGTSVGVNSRIGFRVLTRVTGDITPAAALDEVRTGYATSWNVLRPGDVVVSFDAVNEGNTRLVAQGSVSAGGEQSGFPEAGQPTQELLPGDSRDLTATVQGVWPFVFVPVTITLVPEAVTMDGSSPEVEPVVLRTHVWAVPWPQLAVLLGLVLLVTAVVWDRRRSRRRLERMLADARDEGRRSADVDVLAGGSHSLDRRTDGS